MERATRNLEFLLKYDRKWSLIQPRTLRRPATGPEAASAARDIRQSLGLDDAEPLLDVARHAATLGLLVFSFDLGTDAADAASVQLTDGGVALINGERRVGRRRLAVAHELGHYVFADGYTVDWRIAEQEDDTAWESRLDRFARELLLPERGLRSAWAEEIGRHDELRTAAVLIASRFRVDMATLSRRLAELGLVSSEQASHVRRLRTTKADIVELNLVAADEITAPYLPSPYLQSILRLYRQETISAPRALELLYDTWTEADLPILPPLPESAIWNFVS